MESINTSKTPDTETIERKRASRGSNIFQSRFIRFAAAAAVIIAIVLSVKLFDWPGGSGVAWAEVIRRVEKAQDFICRVEQENNVEPVLEMVQYSSAEHGLRIDMYRDDRLVAAQHLKASSNTLFILVHRTKDYALVELTDQQREAMAQSNAQELVKHFRSMEFKKLGTKKFDGVKASGIEIENPEGLKTMFEESSLKLWVDEKTNWPVRIEFKGVAMGGKVRMNSVLDRFQWNPPLTADDFAFEIPTDYTMMGTVEAVRKDEASAIDGLRKYAEFSGGQYPSALSYATALHEADDVMAETGDRQKYFDYVLKIQNTCAFYSELVDAGKDAAYNGGSVSIRDFDRVLLRWRLDDGRYRVIYGDLREETVSAARLEQLESRK